MSPSAQAELASLLQARRDRALPAMLSAEELGGFAAAYAAVGRLEGYQHVPKAAATMIADWQRKGCLEAGLEAALMQAALDSLPRVMALPPRLRHHHLRHFTRIATQQAPCKPDADGFRKDLGLATLRLHAAGNQVADPRSGVPRSVLWRGRRSEIPTKLFAMLRLGGFQPFLQIHMHPLCRKPFDAETRAETYRSCAELLDLLPGHLGMLAGSWFYDPALEAVSPHLGYLHQVPKAGGAHFFFSSDKGGFVEWALSSSATRRQAHAEGRYQPRSFLLIWGREALQRWASANPGQPAVAL